jgi:late competence protein required for DNA uptake (superfamily II DNA/RNA helicase)
LPPSPDDRNRPDTLEIIRRLKMKCDRCNTVIEEGEAREHLGQMLCEDCYMDALSPAKSCDPWAVHSAKSFERHSGSPVTLTPVQTEILRILEETGGIEREALLEQLKGKLTRSQVEKEFATLRHMEKVRAEKRGGKIFLRIW